MILLDKPYVSSFLQSTLINLQIPVIDTPIARELCTARNIPYISPAEAIHAFKSKKDAKLYTNSENSIAWIKKHLSFTSLPEKIDLFKDKAEFREMLRHFYPDYFFQTVAFSEISSFSISDIPKPFIIKPSVGFFSMGVSRVDTEAEWKRVQKNIYAEMKAVKNIYPPEVMNNNYFLIEEYIDGDEYAVDCYYDENGLPVILNIMKHLFGGDKDVSDRVYITSGEIVLNKLETAYSFLDKVGQRAGLKNFPVHAELRINSAGEVIPVEINPMRFGGWCSTADMAAYAYGLNPYACYFQNRKPDWEQLIQAADDDIYSIIILDNNSGISAKKIAAFDYQKLLSEFQSPVELRKVDYHEYPVFAFLFTRTAKSNIQELERILTSNLHPYIVKR